MEIAKTDPILLVCADQARAFSILEKLDDEGFAIVGSAPSAGIALALTAQTMPRIAILAGPTDGRRSAVELAAELAGTWGVECFVLSLDGADAPAKPERSDPASAVLERALESARLRAA